MARTLGFGLKAGYIGSALPPRTTYGEDVAGRNASITFENFLSDWRRSAGAAASVLSTTDGRWAFVSTSVTALIAGSIAWLAAGTLPPATSQGFQTARDHSLLPYQLFLRLSSQNNAAKVNYAGFGPTGTIAGNPARGAPPASLDATLANEQSGADNADKSGIETRTITMDSGDTLIGALTDAGVTMADANSSVLALKKIYNVRSLRAGQSFELTFAQPDPAQTDPVTNVKITYTPPSQTAGGNDSGTENQQAETAPAGRLLSVSFSPTVDHDITIARGADDAFTAQDTQKQLEAKFHHAGATIDSSLYLAAMQAGIPADVVVQMIHMFSYEVDFQRDIHPGDSFEVLYNYYYTPDGQPVKNGSISYAAMKLAGRTLTLYRYQPSDDDTPEYFNAKGQSAKSMLMKTPVDGARISSNFGMRFHPVLGYSRMHKGVDFAVPVGTPVMAAGSGTVKFEGRARGYGNFLLLKHGNGYSTAYGHLSRFARGLHDGSRVHQGQIVAYSGNTGLTTGPHLHYEIRINGKQVNPLRVKIATGRMLKGKNLKQFMATRKTIDTRLAAMPMERKVAEGAGDLRTAKD